MESFSIPAQSTWLERHPPPHSPRELWDSPPGKADPEMCFPAAALARCHSHHPTTYSGPTALWGPFFLLGRPLGEAEGQVGFPCGSQAREQFFHITQPVWACPASRIRGSPLSLALLWAWPTGSQGLQCSAGGLSTCAPSKHLGGWPGWANSQEGQRRHLRGGGASSDPGTRHSQGPARPGMAGPMRHEIGKEELCWDELKQGTGVRGLEVKADPAHRCRESWEEEGRRRLEGRAWKE